VWQAAKADFASELSTPEENDNESSKQKRPSAIKAMEQQGVALSEEAAAAKQEDIGAKKAPCSTCCVVQ
jgi:hypothetical protein